MNKVVILLIMGLTLLQGCGTINGEEVRYMMDRYCPDLIAAFEAALPEQRVLLTAREMQLLEACRALD